MVFTLGINLFVKNDRLFRKYLRTKYNRKLMIVYLQLKF